MVKKRIFYQASVILSFVVFSFGAPPRVKRQTANEVATRIVAVSKSKPELLRTAVSQADPDLLRAALTSANPDLLEVALTKSKSDLLATALTKGVEEELLRTALTRARTDTLATALTAADPGMTLFVTASDRDRLTL